MEIITVKGIVENNTIKTESKDYKLCHSMLNDPRTAYYQLEIDNGQIGFLRYVYGDC